MNQTIVKALLLTLPLAFALPAIAAPPEGEAEGAPTEGAEVAPPSEEGEPTEEEALADDILLVIDLPLAADEARDAGVEEAEIVIALEAAEAAAVSPGDMTEALTEEASETRATGKREAFGQWVKQQVAQGVKGKALAEAIKARKAELAPMTDEEKAELDAKLKEVGEKRRERKQKVHELRKQLKEAGKESVLAGKERHDAIVAAVSKRHADEKAKWAKAKGKGKGKGKGIDERQDAIDDKQEAIDDKQEAVDDKQEAAGPEGDAKLEKIEDKLEKREDKLEKREDRLEKIEDKKDAHAGHKGEGKADNKGAKKAE